MTKIPQPQAIGWVEAQIVDLDGQRAHVLLEDGTKIPCLLPANPETGPDIFLVKTYAKLFDKPDDLTKAWFCQP